MWNTLCRTTQLVISIPPSASPVNTTPHEGTMDKEARFHHSAGHLNPSISLSCQHYSSWRNYEQGGQVPPFSWSSLSPHQPLLSIPQLTKELRTRRPTTQLVISIPPSASPVITPPYEGTNDKEARLTTQLVISIPPSASPVNTTAHEGTKDKEARPTTKLVISIPPSASPVNTTAHEGTKDKEAYHSAGHLNPSISLSCQHHSSWRN